MLIVKKRSKAPQEYISVNAGKAQLKELFRVGFISMFLLLIYTSSKATPVSFIVFGDTRGPDNGVNTTILAEIAQATITEGVDFILVTGDLVNGYTDPETLESQLTTWRDTLQPLYDVGIGVYPCRGNHDAGNKMAWDNVFSGYYALPGNGPIGEENVTYSFMQENVFIVVLDQYGDHPRQVNQTWLNEQFASNTQPHIFVFGHEPAFAVYHQDCLDDYPNERNEFWQSIVSACGKIYFASHDHLYNHSRIDDGDSIIANDLHHYVVGTGGAPPYSWNGNYDGNNASWIPQLVYHEEEYGFTLVEVENSDVTITWKHRTVPGVYEAGGDVLTYTYDTYPPQGNGIGDVCDCEGNFDCDQDCDGTDATKFKTDFGRSTYLTPCNDEAQCNGDFDCDGDCDGTDAALFKTDFGRSSFGNPCPACVVGEWCNYPLQ